MLQHLCGIRASVYAVEDTTFQSLEWALSPHCRAWAPTSLLSPSIVGWGV